VAKAKQVADINEKRALRGLPPLTRVEMLAFCYGQWTVFAWPANWHVQLADYEQPAPQKV
jgi:hypothetical protein